jgi:lysosomal-associated membrane protein 1/2
MDCDYQPNDIVPVAVGVTLAALVVCVLLAYLFGRRRARQRGYQSV